MATETWTSSGLAPVRFVRPVDGILGVEMKDTVNCFSSFVSAKALRVEADWSLETSVPLQVVYTLSPFQQSVMSGLFKDIPSKLSKKISEVRAQQGGNRFFKGRV